MTTGRVLIVEDDEDLALMLEYNLRGKGHTTFSAPDGPEGLRLMEAERPDLVLLDIMLPGMDGWEVCRTIRGDERLTIAQTPIIMLTALASPQEKIKGIELGADDYIVKPFSVREVLGKVDRWIARELDRRRLAMEVQRLETTQAQTGDFHDMLFHELRNRLMIIGGFSERIAGDHGLPPDKYRRCADIIRDCTISLCTLTEEMLLMSRVESGGQPLPLQDVSLEDALRHVTDSLTRQAEEKGIGIRVERAGAIPMLPLNPTAVRAVLSNLVENAVKYSPYGSEIVIRVGVKTEQAGCVMVEVENPGPLIPAHERRRLFEKFYRGEGVRNKTKGTGLGLYISRMLMRLMGGDVCLVDNDRNSNCFRLAFYEPSRNPAGGAIGGKRPTSIIDR